MSLIGHAPQQAAFADALGSGRMHHAWLLAGPEGVGKRRFADLAALALLSGGAALGEGAEGAAARLIAAGSHPDLRQLEREARDDGRLKAEIAVDQVRALGPLFHGKPAMGGWRVVIADPVDALGRAAANALLKMLEEPPPATVFLLVSHAPGRLLPTIRSRARRLRFGRLGEAETRAVLAAGMPGAAAAELDALARLADGAPGRAIRHAGLDAAALQAELDRLANTPPDRARRTGLALARQLAGKANAPRYEAFLDLSVRRLAAAARRTRGPALGHATQRWAEARELAESAVPLSLDPAQTVTALAGLVAGCDLPGP